MVCRTTFSLAILAACAAALGQGAADGARAKRSDEIVGNMQKVQLLNQVMPLAMTKEQILKILPPIERARARVKTLLDLEYQDLLKYEKAAQQSVQASIEKGHMPEQKFLGEIGAFFQAAEIRRRMYINENVDSVLQALKSTLNKGQLTVAAKSLTLQFYEPNVKPDKVDDECRMRVFVREVLLHSLTYDMLVQMSKRPG